jgi:phage shock protein E
MKLLLFAVSGMLLLSACTGNKTSRSTSGLGQQQSALGAEPGSPPASMPKLLVLDVRTPEEFNGGHVAGAVNVPLDELPMRISQVAPQKDAPLAVHCQSGGRSARAKKLLDSRGYTQVQDLGSLAHARQVLEGKQE